MLSISGYFAALLTNNNWEKQKHGDDDESVDTSPVELVVEMEGDSAASRDAMETCVRCVGSGGKFSGTHPGCSLPGTLSTEVETRQKLTPLRNPNGNPPQVHVWVLTRPVPAHPQAAA